MKIAIGNDHVAVELKNIVKQHLQQLGHEVLDCGTNTADSAHYPIFAKRVADAVVSKTCALGVLICGTGVGISIAANKVNGVRAVVCSEPYSARLARQHNDANVVAFGARVIGAEMAKLIVEEFLNAQYQGGRHQTRVDMIAALERKEDILGE